VDAEDAAAVARFSDRISGGEVEEDGGFSWAACDLCGSTLGGDRFAAHGFTPEGKLIHLDICMDCLQYLANGTIPEEWEG